MGQAAYNLCVILSESRPDEAVDWCRKASEANPSNPKFAYSLAFYELKKGDTDAAISTLRKLIAGSPDYPDPYLLLGAIYERQGRVNEARTVYQQALRNEESPPRPANTLSGSSGRFPAGGNEHMGCRACFVPSLYSPAPQRTCQTRPIRS